MRKKDFWTLVLFNLGTLVLLLEHLAGLRFALELMCYWTVVSMIVHIWILKDYIFTSGFVKEDTTK